MNGKLTKGELGRHRGSRGEALAVAMSIHPTTRQGFVREIGALWTEAQDRFLAIGRHLIRAKEILPHGDFEAMVDAELPFGANAAYQLRRAAELVDSGRLPVQPEELPQSYATVYQISTLKPEEIEAAHEQGLLRRDVQRQEITAFKRSLRQRPREPGPDEWDLLIEERARLEHRISEIDARLAEIEKAGGGPERRRARIGRNPA